MRPRGWTHRTRTVCHDQPTLGGCLGSIHQSRRPQRNHPTRSDQTIPRGPHGRSRRCPPQPAEGFSQEARTEEGARRRSETEERGRRRCTTGGRGRARATVGHDEGVGAQIGGRNLSCALAGSPPAFLVACPSVLLCFLCTRSLLGASATRALSEGCVGAREDNGGRRVDRGCGEAERERQR
jgi:hypothetical protein